MMGRPNLNDNDESPNKQRRSRSSRQSNGSSYQERNPNEAAAALGLESSIELSQINL